MADLDFNKNDDKIRLLISDMKRKYSIISLGVENKNSKTTSKGKLKLRKNYLKDSDSKFLEIDPLQDTKCMRNMADVLLEE